jgi:hypothetical protein
MHIKAIVAIIGVAVIVTVLWDAFETIILPRRVTRKIRWARMFYRFTWRPWAALARTMSNNKRREAFLSYFGPLSLLMLLVSWALALVFGFAACHWANGSQMTGVTDIRGYAEDLYFSGTSFFTLGLGDLEPHGSVARFLTVAEAGLGFGFLALIIGYLPVIYQAFSRREVNISLLDARAGSPPTAAELLRRHSHDHGMQALQALLRDWEHWAAELMETHLSYPVLAYFRSQHDNQSWLGALTAILDTSALVMAGVEGACQRQAELTFAIARHAIVDIAQVFAAKPSSWDDHRLTPADLRRMRGYLADAGLRLHDGEDFEQKLASLRRMYEPYVTVLAAYLAVAVPLWIKASDRADNWQTSAWEKAATLSRSESAVPVSDPH